MQTKTFRVRIREALAKPALQAALDYNSEKRKTAFSQAFQELPQADFHRAQARQARQRVIDQLDDYLSQFIQAAQANGMQVHRAANGEEAVLLVKEIAANHSARLMVKAKTMVSEEIELNQAMEAEGIEIVETDLGEFIVQLRGERPGHILTPAVHLRRAEVGQTFTEKLGTPYTEDVIQLTQVARRTLREKFLSADIGVSGVNFGVAENGVLCILTNEGNGRMCTTLPRVHIALMGMERLVANMDDLAKMLKVLPRASTGQKLTVYTNLIRGPRQNGEPDGAGERHLIILDNGRSGLRSGPFAEALNCLRCGACLNVCPVFREIGGHAYVGESGQVSVYSGPIGSVIAPGLFGVQNFGNLARASSLCGACREACPVDIDLPSMLLKVRAEQAPGESLASPSKIPFALRTGLSLYSWVASSPWRFHTVQKLAGIFSGLVANAAGWIRLPAFTGWGYAKDFPRPAVKTFREQFSARSAPTLDAMASNKAQETVGQVSNEPQIETPAEEQLVKQFQREVEALGAEFIQCTHSNLSEKISEVLRDAGCNRIWGWDDANFPEGLFNKIAQEGIAVVSASGSVHELAQIKAGLTGVTAAAAETGTLAIPGGPGRPLMASLLPEIHLAVLHQEQIVQTLEQLFHNPELFTPSSAALVSGPSRTGDIELTLTVGVHGPKRVVVFCLPA
jgi:L-lactate dehydrogenase complex protein LldF